MLITTPPDADSYASLEWVDAYHSAQGNAAWTGDETAKEAALRRATGWIDATYGARFAGVKTGGRDQTLLWPRSGVRDADRNALPPDTVPREIVAATAEAALRELISPGGLAPDYVASRTVMREKLGSLEREYASSTGVSGAVPVLTVVDGILAGLIGRRSSGVVMLRRA